MTASREESRKRDAEHGIRGIGLAADRPGGPPPDRQPITMPRHPGICRKIDAGLGSAAIADPDNGIEKADPLDKDQPLLFSLAVVICPHRHMIGRDLKDY